MYSLSAKLSQQTSKEVQLEIIPFLGEARVATADFRIQVDPSDKTRVASLLVRSSNVVVVNNNDTFAIAKATAGQLKAMLQEIQDAKRASKRPFSAVETAIENLAVEVSTPVETEHKRVLELMNLYVEAIEREEKEAARRKAAAFQAQIAEQQRQLREARQAQERAETEARKAQDLAQRMHLQAEAQRRQEAAEQVELEQGLALEASQLGNNRLPQSKVPGGRVDHPYEFKLVSVEAVVKAGGWRLLRWELDKRACADSVRAQKEINPDAEPSLPGIEITQRVSVSVRASA